MSKVSRAVKEGIKALDEEVGRFLPKPKSQFVLCPGCRQRIRVPEIKAEDRCPLCNARLKLGAA